MGIRNISVGTWVATMPLGNQSGISSPKGGSAPGHVRPRGAREKLQPRRGLTVQGALPRKKPLLSERRWPRMNPRSDRVRRACSLHHVDGFGVDGSTGMPMLDPVSFTPYRLRAFTPCPMHRRGCGSPLLLGRLPLRGRMERSYALRRHAQAVRVRPHARLLVLP